MRFLRQHILLNHYCLCPQGGGGCCDACKRLGTDMGWAQDVQTALFEHSTFAAPPETTLTNYNR